MAFTCSPSTFEINEDSNTPRLETQLLEDGTPVDLTNTLGVALYVYDALGLYLVSGQDMTIDAAATGEVSYSFTVHQTAIPGSFTIKIRETHAEGDTEVTDTFYMDMTILEEVSPDLLPETMTLAQLNAKVSDATLDDEGDARTPTAHDHSGETLKPAQLEIGDLTFANGWVLTELEDVEGIALLDSRGREVVRWTC